MADGDLVFMPGDTIEFAVELEHDFNIGDAWAVFLRRQEREGDAPIPLRLDVITVEEVRPTHGYGHVEQDGIQGRAHRGKSGPRRL